MTRWTIAHNGVPVAAIEAAGPEQLGAVAADPLDAFEALRDALPTAWRDADADPPGRGPLDPDLELRDEWGALVPTTRLELVVTGPRSAVAFVAIDTVAPRVGAPVRLRPRGATDAAPEA